MKLGVITDGISRDLDHALGVMSAFDLYYAELQFIGDKEVGDLDTTERKTALELIKKHDKKVSCISRHLFAGMPMASSKVGDEVHTKHMDALKRCIGMAHEFGSPLVRIMTGKKEMILWGKNGAEKWNVAQGAWDAQVPLIAPAVELAKKEGITLVVETGNGTMVNSNYTARKLIDELGLVENAATVGEYLRSEMRTALGEHANVGDIRGVGMLCAIEFVRNRDTREGFNPSKKLVPQIYAALMAKGVISRAMPQGDILGFSPPLCLSKAEADIVVEKTAAAVKEVLG